MAVYGVFIPARQAAAAMELLTLGPFAVTRDGALRPREAGPPPAFRFRWRGRPCEAAVEADGLRLVAIAGRIPSTAERGADRGTAFRTIAALPGLLPPGWRLRLLPDHRIQVELETVVASTATSMIAAMVHFVLALDPCLDRLDSNAPPGAQGRLNT